MIKRYQYETGYSSGLLSGNSDMQLRQQLRHRFDQGEHSRRDLLQVPSLLHRSAEGCQGPRTHRPLQQEVRHQRVIRYQIAREAVTIERRPLIAADLFYGSQSFSVFHQ